MDLFRLSNNKNYLPLNMSIAPKNVKYRFYKVQVDPQKSRNIRTSQINNKYLLVMKAENMKGHSKNIILKIDGSKTLISMSKTSKLKYFITSA